MPIQCGAGEKCLSAVISGRATSESAAIPAPVAAESGAKLKRIARDSPENLQLSAASRVSADAINWSLKRRQN